MPRNPTSRIAKETCAVPFALLAAPDRSGEFVGLASAFGTLIDAVIPSRVLPGAFKKTLKEQGDRVRILWQHDPEALLGFPVELREIPEGLMVRARISQTSLGKDVTLLLKDADAAGAALDLSIGFDPIKWEMATESGVTVRLLRELRLWEVSVVTWGANPDAKVLAVARRLDAATLTARRRAIDSALEAERKRARMRDLPDSLLDARRGLVEAELRRPR